MVNYNNILRKTLEEQAQKQIAIDKALPLFDDKSASLLIILYPEMQYNGALIPAKTRINWHGNLKRSTVDVWDTEANNPDNASTLWEDIAYKDGFRIIPETITATLAFTEGEYGWWKDELYRSKVGGNVYTPEVYPDYWEVQA